MSNASSHHNGIHNLRKRFIAVAMLVLIGAFLYVVSSMLLGAVGGLLLWAMSRGMYERILKWTHGRKNLAAGLSVVAILFLVIGPVVSILTLMVNDAVNLTEQAIVFFNKLKPRIDSLLSELVNGQSPSFLGFELDIEVAVEKMQEFSGTAVQFIVMAMQKTAGGVASAFVQIFVMLYTLFFCYTDGQRFIDWLKELVPLSPHETDRLFTKFFDTSITTLKALGIIGVVQGALGGFAFWVCGIPSPFFWTVLLVFATVIPVVGAQIIIVPASIALMLFGDVAYGIGLLLWSGVVIANIDNLLRPYLVGRAVQLHELIVFLTTFGGLVAFGFWGFLIGPVIASLLKVLAELYIESNAPPPQTVQT